MINYPVGSKLQSVQRLNNCFTESIQLSIRSIMLLDLILDQKHWNRVLPIPIGHHGAQQQINERNKWYNLQFTRTRDHLVHFYIVFAR